MAFGDTIDILRYEPLQFTSLRFRVVEGKSTERRAALQAESFWSETRLELAEPFSNGGNAGSETLRSLIRDRHTAIGLSYNGYGVEAVSLPFSHYVMLTGFDAASLFRVFEKNLADRISREQGAFVDPETGVRVLCQTGGQLGPDDVWFFFGYGIFAPNSEHERIVGCIAIVQEEGDADVRIPRLPNGMPAAFFRGQAGIAFSGDQRLTPATVEGLPRGIIFYLGRMPGTEHEPGKTVLDLRCHTTAEAETFVEIADGAPSDGWDGSFGIQIDGRRTHTLYYSLDGRNSRLHATKPATGAWFSLLGFVPEPFVPSAYRWWVDIAPEGPPAHSALSRVSRALVTGDGWTRIFDWTRFEYGHADPSETVAVGRRQFSVTYLHPPAFLACPEPGQAIIMSPAPPAPEASEGNKTYELDWVDHACRVEFADGRVAGLAKAMETPPRYRLESGVGGLLLTAITGFLAGSKGGDLPFDATARVHLEKGVRVILGGMLLEFGRD